MYNNSKKLKYFFWFFNVALPLPQTNMAIVYSICIPRAFKNISEKRIRAIFYSLKLGFVERVDMVSRTSQAGEDYNRVFIHFSSWNESNQQARELRERLNQNTSIKIIYDDPWYWMISKSTAPPPEKSVQRPKPRIDFEDNNTSAADSPPPTDAATAAVPATDAAAAVDTSL